jgi:hypothetical protein
VWQSRVIVFVVDWIVHVFDCDSFEHGHGKHRTVVCFEFVVVVVDWNVFFVILITGVSRWNSLYHVKVFVL